MNCSKCAFFTNNILLLCAVNPTHCSRNAEPCREFEAKPKCKPVTIECDNFVYTLDCCCRDAFLQEYRNGKVVQTWYACSNWKDLYKLDDNIAVFEFIEYCSIPF